MCDVVAGCTDNVNVLISDSGVLSSTWLAAYIKEAAVDALDDISAQHYSLPKGRVRLRKALAENLSESFNLGRSLDPENEVIVSAGQPTSYRSINLSQR